MCDIKNQNNLNKKKRYINIEIAYAASIMPEDQLVDKLLVPEDFNIKQAILKSNIFKKFPSINLTNNLVGIFGQIKTLTTSIKDGDRIEIYRSLPLNPNKIRLKQINKE